MPGGQVIYLPQDQTFGGELGKGVGAGLGAFTEREMKRQEEQLHMQKTMQAIELVKAAGSREKALEVISTPSEKGGPAFRTPNEFQMAMKFVNETYPVADNSPHEVTAFGPQGEQVKGFVPRSQLENPQARAAALPAGSSETKPPPMVDMFTHDPVSNMFTATGKKDPTKRGLGEMTRDEIDLRMKQQSDARAAEAATAQTKAAERSAAAGERAAHSSARQDIESSARIATSARSALADIFNVKKTTGADGSFTIDFGGDNKKRKQFSDALDSMMQEVHGKDFKGDINSAATRAATKHGVLDEKPAEVAKPEEPKKGLLDKAKDLKDAISPPEAPRDPKDRVKDKVYTYNNRKYKWTGTGWLPQ